MSFSKTLAAVAATGASLVLLSGCGSSAPTGPFLPGGGHTNPAAGNPGGGGNGVPNLAGVKACSMVDASTASSLAGATFAAPSADAGPTCEYIGPGAAVVVELQPYPNEQLAEAAIQAAIADQGKGSDQAQEVSIGSKAMMQVASDGHSVVIVFAKDNTMGILSVSNDNESVDASKVQSAAKSMADKV